MRREQKVGLEFAWGVASDRGMVRALNEDTFLVRETPVGVADCPGLLVAVADGMGGFGPGLEASNRALDVLYRTVRPSESGAPSPRRSPAETLREAIRAANRSLFQSAREGQRVGTGTTLSVCWFLDSTCHVASVGDSRVYQLRHGKLLRLTRDHSLGELLRRHGGDEGLIASDWGTTGSLRLLGTHPSVPVDVKEVELLPGDRILVATDGITDAAQDSELCQWLDSSGHPDRAAERIVAATLRLGGQDNATAVVVESRSESALSSGPAPRAVA